MASDKTAGNTTYTGVWKRQEKVKGKYKDD